MATPSPWTVFLLSLAVWRISNMVVNEDGPWDWFARLRGWGFELDAAGNAIWARYDIMKVLACTWCFSIWVGLGAIIVYLLTGERVIVILSLPFSLSTISIFIEQVIDRLSEG
jgi:hypothetical protein